MKQHLLSVRDLHGSSPHCHIKRGLTFDMMQGELVALISPPGPVPCAGCADCSHLSYLLRSIARIVPPQRGEVIFHGQDISFPTEEEWADLSHEIRFVFTDDRMLNPRMSIKDTLKEIVRWTPASRRSDESTNPDEQILKLLTRLDMGPCILGILSGSTYPHALSPVDQLKVSLGRALIASPSLLVIDAFPASWSEDDRASAIATIQAVHREFRVAILFVAQPHDSITESDTNIVDVRELFATDFV